MASPEAFHAALLSPGRQFSYRTFPKSFFSSQRSRGSQDAGYTRRWLSLGVHKPLYRGGSPVTPFLEWGIPSQRNQRTDNNYFD